MNTPLVHVHFYIQTLNLTGRFGSPVASINTAINVKFLEKDYREQLTHTGLFLACVPSPKRGGVVSMPFSLPTNPLSTLSTPRDGANGSQQKRKAGRRVASKERGDKVLFPARDGRKADGLSGNEDIS